MHTTRTNFLHGTLAVGSLGLTANANVDPKAKLPITIAGYDVDKVRALASGKVPVEGCAATFVKDAIGDMNTAIFKGKGTREVSEVGLHPFMLAYANDGFREYTLIPVFPLRVFRHKSIFIRAGSGIKKTEDLKGQEFEETKAAMGDHYWPYGIEPNRKALETLFQYSCEQGLASKKLAIEELFESSTMMLSE